MLRLIAPSDDDTLMRTTVCRLDLPVVIDIA